MIKNILFLILGSLCYAAQAQSSDGILKKHFKAFGKNQPSYFSKNEMASFLSDNEIIQLLDKYISDEKEAIAGEAIRLTASIGAKHEKKDSRERAVFQLLTRGQTAEGVLMDQVVKGLKKFKQEDFSQVNIDLLLQLIEAKRPQLGELIELAGFLQLKEQLTEMKATFSKNKKLKKSVGMALVRSGDEQKMESLMKSIGEIKVDDDFIYGVVPLLVYARQKETTNFLFDVILSDEKACTPNGPDVGGNILCAYRVMEEIAPYIKDFPVEVGGSGDLKVESYPQALKEVRSWISKHQSDYELVTEIY